LKDLQNCPIILPEKGSATREYIISEFNKRNLLMTIYVECENPPAIKHMVHFGLGGAFFCLYDIEDDVKQRRFRKINLIENLSLNYDLIYLKERKDSKIVEIFDAIMQRLDMSLSKNGKLETEKTIQLAKKKDPGPSL
jgi:DNA-binding transcriptional LysR family regulator